MNSKPVVTAQPQSLTKAVGETATFRVTATGAESYQWQYRTSPEGSWNNVTLASGKTANYKLTVKAKHDGYQYRCAVTNANGTTYSDIVTLTVG